ncbi:hypothetical protein [Nitratiruptor sp. YY09-18]|uniref:hypothetical protein n=1 Tax=Nitratiruptor sp. YY09-18 TaxID=2724901 RepID=UPI0019156E5B|nr:hypothetical protein [Nitratiruptor sp. YY09-18]BCD68258.1 hypothetical protein NitYY0918_C1169 [Nitratiruptor sp. YY09-18]
MQFLHSHLELLFWLGVFVIIFFYVGFLYMRFRYENFDFSKHKFIAIIYIVLMVLTIVVWRYLLGIVFNEKFLEMIITNIEV